MSLTLDIDIKDRFSSPQISPVPSSAETRLIDTGMLHYEASTAGHLERYKHGETTHTLHVWWARRPHSSMRILAFASLCKESDSNAIAVMSNILNVDELGSNIIHKAREILNKQYGRPPKVLDMFAGGGTIPFEVANIGAQSYSIDANELSVFIQKCNLIYSQKINLQKIRAVIKQSGINVLRSLEKHTNKLFPLREDQTLKGNQTEFLRSNNDKPFGYIWTYSIKCPDCKYIFYLSKRPWLSRKNNRRIAMVFTNNEEKQSFSVDENISDSYEQNSNWLGKNGKAVCPKCSCVIQKVNIKNIQDELIAIIKPKERGGKEFIAASSENTPVPAKEELEKLEKDIVKELNLELPEGLLPVWSGIINPALYGIETYSDFLNPRQRVVLLILIQCLLREYNNLKDRESESTAKFIIFVLSSLIDQLVDWNCRLSMWISQNEQVGRAFCGPGVSMLWDYVEIDPVLKGPANLWSKLNRILDGVDSIVEFPYQPIVSHSYAQKLPFEDNMFDAIITDPPYYDNIYYSILSDFFYSWKRILLKHLDPELFKNETTDFKHELVASTYRNNTPELAHKVYCEQLTRAVKEAARVLHPKGVLSFVYSHSSLKGWDALIKSFRESNFVITSVQPLSIERKHRPRSMYSDVINTCIVFVARKVEYKNEHISINEVLRNISLICENYAPILRELGWQNQDIALSIFVHGVGYLANYLNIAGVESDEEALKLFEEFLRQDFKDFRIKDRNPL